MWQEFKKFISKGNVVDLAVGIIIGAAFSKIVASFVADVLMPVVSLGLGKVNFTNLFVTLNGKHYGTLAEAKEAAAPTLNYGIFMNACLDFFIIGFAVFLIVKAAHHFQRKEAAAQPPPPATKDCPFCFTAIPVKATRCPHCTSALA